MENIYSFDREILDFSFEHGRIISSRKVRDSREIFLKWEEDLGIMDFTNTKRMKLFVSLKVKLNFIFLSPLSIFLLNEVGRFIYYIFKSL